MANRQETTFVLDGHVVMAYSERAAHIRKLERLYGPPDRRGRQGATAFWDHIPADEFRWGKKRKGHKRHKTNTHDAASSS